MRGKRRGFFVLSTTRKGFKIAKESRKTKRAREKLHKKLKSLEKKFTQEALQKKRLEIHSWIARHSHYRVVLRDKNISLFDENQNAAKLSEKVSSIVLKLQKEFQQRG